MSRWVCPRCDREFGRAHQSHVCVPGTTVDGTFTGRAERWRPIYDEIAGHVRTLGPVHEDAVGVGVFLKHEVKFAEVRPYARSLQLLLFLPRPLDDARVSRSMTVARGKFLHYVKLTDPADVDETVRGWLTEAYDA